jgi:hypothetical protein
MAHPSLITAWALEECKVVRSGHRKAPCERCAGRGFRWIKYFPCHVCAGGGRVLARMPECADRLEFYIGELARRIHDQTVLIGLEVPSESVDERLRRISHKSRPVR